MHNFRIILGFDPGPLLFDFLSQFSCYFTEIFQRNVLTEIFELKLNNLTEKMKFISARYFDIKFSK